MADDAAPTSGDGWTQVANEFTTVRVRKRHTRNGERLEVRSARLGTSILLDPLELESLTWQTTETFSRMLQDPYGPEEVDGRPLSELVGDGDVVAFGGDDDASAPDASG